MNLKLKNYSDDSVEDVNMSYKGTSVELEVNSLAPQDKSQVVRDICMKRIPDQDEG